MVPWPSGCCPPCTEPAGPEGSSACAEVCQEQPLPSFFLGHRRSPPSGPSAGPLVSLSPLLPTGAPATQWLSNKQMCGRMGTTCVLLAVALKRGRSKYGPCFSPHAVFPLFPHAHFLNPTQGLGPQGQPWGCLGTEPEIANTHCRVSSRLQGALLSAPASSGTGIWYTLGLWGVAPRLRAPEQVV